MPAIGAIVYDQERPLVINTTTGAILNPEGVAVGPVVLSNGLSITGGHTADNEYLTPAGVQAIATAGTILTAAGVVPVTVAAAATGVILAAGTKAGQQLTVINRSGANTVTMAASGTSNVANGVSCVIAVNAAKGFVWDAVQALWYPTA